MRKLMERHGLQFGPQPGQPEMVGIMDWFMGRYSPLSEVAPEFGLMRDMAAIYKFLVTMQTRESELMQRCAGRSEMIHWSRVLSADDPLGASSQALGFEDSSTKMATGKYTWSGSHNGRCNLQVW